MTDDDKAGRLRQRGRPPQVTDKGRSQMLGTLARKRIGTHLRAMYDGVLQQPVPDRFAELIAKLEEAPARLHVSDS